jgi:hypothetical protein
MIPENRSTVMTWTFEATALVEPSALARDGALLESDSIAMPIAAPLPMWKQIGRFASPANAQSGSQQRSLTCGYPNWCGKANVIPFAPRSAILRASATARSASHMGTCASGMNRPG